MKLHHSRIEHLERLKVRIRSCHNDIHFCKIREQIASIKIALNEDTKKKNNEMAGSCEATLISRLTEWFGRFLSKMKNLIENRAWQRELGGEWSILISDCRCHFAQNQKKRGKTERETISNKNMSRRNDLTIEMDEKKKGKWGEIWQQNWVLAIGQKVNRTMGYFTIGQFARKQALFGWGVFAKIDWNREWSKWWGRAKRMGRACREWMMDWRG